MNACARMSSPETASSTLRGPSETVVMACLRRVGVGARAPFASPRSYAQRGALRGGGQRLDEREDELSLTVPPAHVDRLRETAEERDDGPVVAAHRRDEPRDAGRTRVGRQLA